MGNVPSFTQLVKLGVRIENERTLKSLHHILKQILIIQNSTVSFSCSIMNIPWWYSSSLLACLSPFFLMFWYISSSSCLPFRLSSLNSVYEKKYLVFVFWVWLVLLKFPFLSLFSQMTISFSSLWLIKLHYVCMPSFFTHSSSDKHIGWLWNLTLVCKLTLISMNVSLDVM